ncbi:MAG: hypothetical protein JXO72_13055 [Vicinamibacteria bacterium]|nr:hypothetical protein [Vicinamibacteria bacterium]
MNRAVGFGVARAPVAALLAIGLVGMPTFDPSACGRLRLTGSGERAILTRRVEKLRKLVNASRAGSILAEHDMTLVLDQGLIAAILGAHLPWEDVVADRYRVRITEVAVECEDGLALLVMEGRVGERGVQPSDEFAALRLFGEVDVVDLDDVEGTLKGRVSLLAFEVRPAGVFERHGATRRLLDEFGRLRIHAFETFARPFEVPVRLERVIDIPPASRHGAVRLHAGRLAVTATVSDVLAYDGRLWIALRADVTDSIESPSE